MNKQGGDRRMDDGGKAGGGSQGIAVIQKRKTIRRIQKREGKKTGIRPQFSGKGIPGGKIGGILAMAFTFSGSFLPEAVRAAAPAMERPNMPILHPG